jgi:CHAT domain-containing protein
VGACIGSLWPIYDAAAADFAREFYNEALKGSMLGEAMRLARKKIRDAYPDQITWAAFALYGDPTFRLGS